MNDFPSKFGYHMPAEWEPHEATWLAWPHNPDTWPGNFPPIPQVWVEMIRHLTPHEKVHLNVNDSEMETSAKTLLTKANVNLSQVVFHHFPTNDCWSRDHGPIFIVRQHQGKKEIAITKWNFNKWGGKYPPWDLDNLIPYRIAEEFHLPLFDTGIILEGGSIEVNGQGTLLTTEACLLNKNRNPHLTKQEIETYLKNYLAVTHILWLGDGIIGDDTDGHIDDLTRFVNPNTVVTVVEEDPADENYKILQDNLACLKTMKDQSGKPLTIKTLPMPGPVFYEGQRLPASYANFYIANNIVLLPTYRHPNDQKAQQILQSIFPDRNIIGIDCTDLIWGLGAFHCVTQQQPALK